MNKTKKFFTIAIMAIFAISFFSSCAKNGGQHYSAVNEYAYLMSTENGTVYARTLSGFLITAPRIASEKPGRCAFISFSITPETEKITVNENFLIYKARLDQPPVFLHESPISFMAAPKDAELTKFSHFHFPPNNFAFTLFGNKWPFSYELKLKKGEEVDLHFYVSRSDENEDVYSSQDLIIDIRAEKTGTPVANAEESVARFTTVCDFTELRRELSHFLKDESAKSATVRFRLYRELDERPIMSEQYNIEALSSENQ